MTKPSLTPENVDALTQRLYGLTDSELIVEADAVSSDFNGWLDNQFDLTPEQVTYIDTFPPIVKKFYGNLFATGFTKRAAISFVAPPDNDTVPRRIKETRMNLFGEINYNDDDKELSGNFEIDISFDLL